MNDEELRNIVHATAELIGMAWLPIDAHIITKNGKRYVRMMNAENRDDYKDIRIENLQPLGIVKAMLRNI